MQVIETTTTPRGTTEKLYALPEQEIDLQPEEFADARPEDLVRYFTSFMGTLLSQGRAFYGQSDPAKRRGGFYSADALYLTDKEFDYLKNALAGLTELAKLNQPGPGRRRRMFFTDDFAGRKSGRGAAQWPQAWILPLIPPFTMTPLFSCRKTIYGRFRAAGGVARRLTANLGTISHPFFSPDGRLLAFTGREEGHNEVYVMPAEGGPIKRLTYLGVSSSVIGWTPDGSKILFSSDYRQPFDRQAFAYAVSPEGGEPQSYPVGHAVSISIGQNGRTVIGRNNNDPARWKRYKGGTAGDIWIDAEGSGTFKRLVQLSGNVARPLCIGERVVFSVRP